MASEHRHALLHHVRNLAARQRSDSELLSCFVSRRDPVAFAGLVQRHGPMVLAVCRRVLGHEHDAEDACQAAWLVLARRAGSIRKHQSVSSWLHGVAYRVAMNLKRQTRRRRAVQGPAITVATADPAQELTWREVRAALDEELERLPERLRAPVLLCYLEGKTRDEAALALGWTAGMLRGRLERGRLLLRARLARRGLALSAALIGTALAEDARAAALPPALAHITIEAATRSAAGAGGMAGLIAPRVAHLTKGVVHAMLVSKLKVLASCVLMACLLIGGAGALCYQTVGAQARELDPQQEPAQGIPAAQGEQLPGGWREKATLEDRAQIPPPQGEQFPGGWREKATLEENVQPPPVGPVFSVDFAPDGKRLAVGRVNGTVTLYDTATGRVVFKIAEPEGKKGYRPVWSVKFAPDGKSLAVAGEHNLVRLWDLAGKLVGKDTVSAGPVLAVAFSPDGRRLAAGSADDSVRIWDLAGGREAVNLAAPRGGTSVAFSPDGRLLAGGREDGLVFVWDASSSREVRRLGRPEMPATVRHSAVAFSPDGKLLAAASDETALRLYDVATGKEMARFGGPQHYLPSVAFSPDGRLLASGSLDRNVYVWDVSGRQVAILKGHRDAVTSVAFSPDGKLLASGSRDGTVKLWQVPDLRLKSQGPSLYRLEPKQALEEYAGSSTEGDAEEEKLKKYLEKCRENDMKLMAKYITVHVAERDIEKALNRLRQATNSDRQTELETLNEIEAAVKEMRKRVQTESKDTKP